MMKKYVKVISVAGIMAVTASGCGKEQESEPVVVKEFEEILPDNAKPVIVRDEEIQLRAQPQWTAWKIQRHLPKRKQRQRHMQTESQERMPFLMI